MPVKVECESCKAPYTIDERRIPAAGLRVRCPKCTKTFVVKKPGDAADGSVTSPAMPAAKAPSESSPDAGLPAVRGGASLADLPAQAPPRADASMAPGKSRSDELDLPAPTRNDAQLPSPVQRPGIPKKPVRAGTAIGLGGIVPGVVSAAGMQQKPTVADLPAQRPAAPAAEPPAVNLDLPAARAPQADLPAARAPQADLPAPRAPAKPSFEVDLPSVGNRAPPRPQAKTHQGFEDLPAPAQTRADLPAQKAPKMEFGEIDLPSVSVGHDLPAARSATQKFGEGDLPEVAGAHLPATRSRDADLPMVSSGAHLPAVAGPGHDLPAVAGPGHNLPAVVSTGHNLPAVAARGRNVPATGSPFDDFSREPSVAMPSPSDPFEPLARDFAVAQTMVGPGVQPQSHGDASGFGELELPGPGGGAPSDPWAAPAGDMGLRSGTARGFGEVDLGGGDLGPSPRAATATSSPAANAPSLGPPPSVGSDFGELELPGPGAGMGASPNAETFGGDQPGVTGNDFGSPGLGEFPYPQAAPTDSRATGGVGFGEVDLGGSGGDDDALEFGAIPEEKRGEGGASPGAYEAPLPQPREARVEAPAPEQAKKPSNAGKFAAGFLALALIGGAALSFTDMGAFGYKAISDKANAEKHAGMLTTAVKRTRDAFGQDSLARATQAVAELQRDVGEAPRYAPLIAYGAYAQFAHELRYGTDPQRDTLARSALGKLRGDVPNRQLAEAARDVVARQFPAARGVLKALTASDPTNVDAWITLGELELLAKQPKDAVVAFDAAVKAKEDARSLAGLMRAHDAAGDFDKAKTAATAITAKYPDHAGSRLLLARYAWERDKDEKESTKWLTELATPNVTATASVLEQVDALTLHGAIHFERGRVSSAKKAFDDAIAIAKGAPTPASRIGLGEVHLANGQYPQAITEFSLASQATPDAALPKIGIARAFLRQEKASEAKAQLVGLKDATLAGEIGFWLGQAEEKISPERPAEAMKIYEGAIKGQPSEVKPYIALANLQAKTGNTQEADATIAAASKNVPPSERLHLGIGELRFRQERYPEALDQFKKALQLQPSNVEALFFKAKTLLRMGERKLLDEGKSVLDQVKEKDDKYPGLALEFGLYFQKTEQINEALDQYKKALERAPDDVDIQLSVARAQVEARMKDAEPRLLEIMGNCSRSPSPDVCLSEANHYYGRAVLTRGEAATAKIYLEKAAAKNDNNAQYHLYLAWALVEGDSLADADREVTRTLELDKSLATAHWLRGEIDVKSGRYKEAIENAQHALKLAPTLSQANATVAWAQKQLNQEEASLAAYDKAIKGDPTNPRAAFWRYNVADIHHHRNSIARATTELKDAIKQVKGQNPPPTWLPKAYFYLGEALRHSDRAEALKAYREYLSTSVGSTDPAVKEAEAAVRALAGK